MKKFLLALLALAATGAGGWAYYRTRQVSPPQVVTAAVTRGDIVDTVGATGTLQAVTTVQVGSQVSGTVLSLGADFNDIVAKGRVITRLDPSLFQTQLEQARANLARAQADMERSRVSLDDASTKYARAQELAARNLLPRSDLDAASVAVDAAKAQLQSSQAQVVQSQAAVNQSQVNLDHTIITAPIDGIVVSRNVDIGQTVAASLQSPTLFVIAADLTKMQVTANVDEADVGRIRPGQRVTFRVDAYPTEEFIGAVAQVRLQPVVIQNVTTYGTVINVPNDQLKLKPGMTATVRIEIARRTGVLRIPNAALRFRPTTEVFAALKQAVPPDQQGESSRARERVGENAGTTATAGGRMGRPPSGNGRAARDGDAGQGNGERSAGTERAPGARRSRDSVVPVERPVGKDKPGSGQTIDALFAPLPLTESTGRVWINVNGALQPQRVRLGISDGTNTELLGDELPSDALLVTNVVIANRAQASQAASGNPLLPGGRGAGGFGPGAGPGGRGR